MRCDQLAENIRRSGIGEPAGEIRDDGRGGQERVGSGNASLRAESAMARMLPFTAIIEREGDCYLALCPELDVASQGATVEEARQNLTEAVSLLLESADAAEIESRLHREVFVTRLEVGVG